MKSLSLFQYAFAISILVSHGSLLAEEKITFVDHVKPVFQKRCATCHNSSRQSGGLDLTNYTNLMLGGGSGNSIEPGDSGSSYLYMLVTHEETPVMPPGNVKIPEKEIQLIADWIDAGALENSGSVANIKKVNVVADSSSTGVRPAEVAFPVRQSLEPFWVSDRSSLSPSMATSPWAPLAALSGTKQILLYDTQRLEYLGSIDFPDGQASQLKFSQNGNLLIGAGGRHGLSGKVFVWDVNTLEKVLEVGDETDNVLTGGISADQSLVALGGPQKMLRVYSTEKNELVYEHKKHTDWITSVSFSPDGVLVASADRNGGLQLWEADSGNEYLTLKGHDQKITSLSWRRDANVLASSSEDGSVKLWEMENGRQIKSWSAHAKGSTCIEFNSDGQILSTGRDSKVKLWDQNGKLIRQYEGLGEIGIATTFCNESKRILASNYSGQVKVWDLGGKLIGALNLNPPKLSDRLTATKQKLLKPQNPKTPKPQNPFV